MDLFFQSFVPGVFAILRIFIIAVTAGLLVRFKFVSDEHINGLSKVTILVFLPCLIFSKITSVFNPGDMEFWWVLPLLGMAFLLVGIGTGRLFFWKDFNKKRHLVAMAGMQNAAYLVLPVGEALFPEQFDTFTVYVFLIVLGVSPVMWTLGKVLTTGQFTDGNFNWKHLITPPFIANILAINMVLLNLHNYVPEFVASPINMLGQAAVPVVTFVLGATLGGISLRLWPHWLDILRVMLVKFVWMPLLVLLLILAFNVYQDEQLLAELLIIEASSAPATSIILMSRTYGGNVQETGTTMLFSYFVCLITIPVWISVLRMVV